MTDESRELVVRRIVVGLDASPHSLAALEAAANLAARLEAELVGMFVEDINLLRLAELPFAREVGTYSGTRRRLDLGLVERQLQAQAERARRALAAHAERVRVRWSFQVTRGGVAPELLSAASDADLVILGRTSQPLSTSRRLGSTAKGVMSQAVCPALVVSSARELLPPVLVIVDGSQLAWKALAVAVSLVREEDRHLIIFLLARGMDAAQRLKAKVANWLREREVVARYRLVARPTLGRLAELIEREGCGTLVLPAQSGLLGSAVILALLDELELPMLLVR